MGKWRGGIYFWGEGGGRAKKGSGEGEVERVWGATGEKNGGGVVARRVQ